MELLKGIISDIKVNRELARERGEERKKEEALRKFFDSPTGKTYLESIQNTWNISKISRKKIISIDNENKQFRLAVDVDNETFKDIVHNRKPELIRYRITHFDDTVDVGDLLIEVDNKIAIQTHGIIFPQTDASRGILDNMSELYILQIKDYPGFQPWQELALKKST